MTRGDLDWTARLPRLVEAVGNLSLQTAILDGEIVALRDDGVSDFQKLQSCINNPGASICYSVFDLLYLNGVDLRRCALQDRKRELAQLLACGTTGLQYVDPVGGNAAALRHRCSAMGR